MGWYRDPATAPCTGAEAHGIHTHGDGVIHIHPFSAEAAGENATLRVFLDSADIELTDDALTVGGETYTEGDDTCDGREGRLEVVRWAEVAEPERVDADARFQDGIAAFDDVAVVCSQLGAACPVGQLALVVDGVVV
ncbi:MAG TPA: hypothetical protein VGO78_03885, partial [Acidimicrobiales bacterium]|nr:hypothetical protein [Acidimicrobiales bacterium]